MIKARDYWVGYLIPLSLLPGFWLGGPSYFATVALVFGVMPLVDYFMGRDPKNPDPVQEDRLWHDFRFSLPLFAYLPVQAAVVGFGAYWYATQPLLPYEQVGLVLGSGIATGGIGITVAHELCHRTNRWSKMSGFFLLTLVSYTHFGIEHVVGHHFRVATPEDPTTARLGENAYWFVARSIIGSFLSVFGFELKRLKKQNRSSWSLNNRMYACVLAPIVLGVALYDLWGAAAVAFFLLQSGVAIFLLEVTNYVEHYGLLRAKKPDGRYERISPSHSWNANQRLSNLLLFKLQRHADHHAHALRPYQVLRHFDESPQLPFGYPTMVLIALVPPLWRRLMDPLVHALKRPKPTSNLKAIHLQSARG